MKTNVQTSTKSQKGAQKQQATINLTKFVNPTTSRNSSLEATNFSNRCFNPKTTRNKQIKQLNRTHIDIKKSFVAK